MNIALITAYFYPYSTGGTERYVYDLGIELQNAGHRVMVICPAKEQADFIHENLRVCAFEEGNNPQFEALLLAEEIHITHFHTLTPAVDTPQMGVAANAGCRVFFSSHITGNTCVRGDLLQYGKKTCDGKVRSQTCMACYLNSKGMPLTLAKTAALATRAIGKPQPLADVVTTKKVQLKKLAGLCKGIFVFSEWQKRTFMLNHIDQTEVIPHAWTAKPGTYADFTAQNLANHTRIGFAGRISPEKGLDVLIEALKQLSSARYSLCIAGVIVQAQKTYYQKLRRQTDAMPNVTWRINLGKAGMAEFFNRIDVLCIPSTGFETGPYVLYEALMAGKPVIASDLGSMRDWAAKGFPVSVFENTDSGSLAKALDNWKPVGKILHLPVPDAAHVTKEIIRQYEMAR